MPWTKKKALAEIKKLHTSHKKLRKAHEKQERDLQLKLESTERKLRGMKFPN